MQPSTAIKRVELGSTYFEFDLAMSRQGFIGNKVLKPRMSAVQSAVVPLVPLKALLLNQSTKRAPSATYQRGRWEWDQYEFNTEEYGWEEPLDDRTLRIYRDLIEAESISAERAKDFVCREYEINCKNAVFDSTVWTGAAYTTAVGVKWDVYATAIPVRDIKAGHEKVKATSAQKPNAVVMNDTVARDLSECDTVVNRILYKGDADPTHIMPTILAQMFWVDDILIGDYAMQNTANEAAVPAISNIWPNDQVMLVRVAKTEDPAETCIGRTIMWSEESAGPGGDDGIAVMVEEYREEQVRGTVLRARTDYALKILQRGCAHRFSNIK